MAKGKTDPDEDAPGGAGEDVDPEALADAVLPDADDIEIEIEVDDEDDDEKDPEAEEEIEVEEKIEFAGAKIATEKELRKALEWAFTGEDAEPELLDRFARHARMVLEAALEMNITKIIDPREVAAKHYLDSWRSTRLLPLMGKSLVDIGSGAGFPGLPIAMSEIHTRVILIEAKAQKAAFLQRVVDELKVKNVTVIADRAEEYLARNRHDVGIMRAISSVRENVRLLRKVRHSIKDLVMLKGQSWSREVRAGEREAERLGFRLDTVWEHELPDGLGQRAVLVYAAPGGQGM